MIDKNLSAVDEGDILNQIIKNGAATGMTLKSFLESEIAQWKASAQRGWQIIGDRYAKGIHDIEQFKRTAIGEDGNLHEVKNLPNLPVSDNLYGKMVRQKSNYLLSQPISIETDNDNYTELLKDVFDMRFMRLIKTIGKDSLNGAIGWIHPYYDHHGNFKMKRFRPFEILPYWSDEEHTELEMALRLYLVEGYEGTTAKLYEKVELYMPEGVYRFDLGEDGIMVADAYMPYAPYMTYNEKPYNWERVPLIPLKMNDDEIPLIRRCKGLQDALNMMWTFWGNGMQSTPWNEILVIKNYDGQDLGEFRRNLAAYGAVKVRSVDGADGGLESLSVEVNAENYKIIIQELRRAIISNAMGYDFSDERVAGGQMNQINIKSLYSDIDLDANDMECEYQAALHDLLWFVNAHLANTGAGDYSGLDVKFIFNRDMLFDEAGIMTMLYQGGLKLSNKTLLSQVPFIDDVDEEMERIEKEETAAREKADVYAGVFPIQE